MEKFSVYKAAQRLGISRSTLLKELKDGRIAAHKRRYRIIFFKQDIECYEKRNTLNYRETSRNTEKNSFVSEKQGVKNLL